MLDRSYSEVTRGTVMGLAAYLLWGLFPVYFDALRPAGPWELLAHRIVWSLLFCLLVLAVMRDFGWIRALRGQYRLLGGVALASFFIAANWGFYMGAVTSGHTSDAALGYFLNPLVTVALGVVVLHETLRPLQWAAVGIGVIAAGYLAVAGGQFPVVALILSCSFAMYSLVKNRVGAHLTALHGLTLETAMLAPAALGVLGYTALNGGLDIGRHGPVHATLIVLSGVATAIPLLLFAAAARRIPLVTVGLIQFITPTMQLLCAVFLLHEHMPAERWIGFGIVWVALILLTADSLLALRSTRSAAREVQTA